MILYDAKDIEEVLDQKRHIPEQRKVFLKSYSSFIDL